MRIFTTHFNAIATSALLIATFNTQAGVINSRTDLNNLLGSNQVIENFESFHITSQTRYSDGPLNSETLLPVLGNHLVQPGITFQRNPDYALSNTGYRGIDFNPSGYFGSTSQAISGAGGSGGASIRNDFQILFTTPVNAFGLDLLAYSGFASAGIISVYDTAGVLLSDTNITGSVGGTFFGWENTAGIGKVFIHDNPNGNYIQFDNIGFGVKPVPVPATIWLFGSALAGFAGLRRRFTTA